MDGQREKDGLVTEATHETYSGRRKLRESMERRGDTGHNTEGAVHGQNATRGSGSVAGAADRKPIMWRGGVKWKRTDPTTKASEVINISSDEEEAEIGESTRAQEHAEKWAAKYDKLLESAGQAKSAQEEAEQRAKRYEVELNETQRQLRALQAVHSFDHVGAFCSWLGRILDQHRHDSDPPFSWTQPVEIPEVATATMTQESYEWATLQLPHLPSSGQELTSPSLRNEVYSAEGRIDMHALAERVIIWDTLFPFHIPADPEGIQAMTHSVEMGFQGPL
ncbi:hypothetical protein IW262DRAFT_1299803 [Armillaria fumosa]|nr:hypothetical protein IW262DRAFT_1299803 [Armillaria fumosa]